MNFFIAKVYILSTFHDIPEYSLVSAFAKESDFAFLFSHFHSTNITKDTFPSAPEDALCLSESCWNGTATYI